MAKARPGNLPTRPQTAQIQRDRARQDKTRFTQTDTLTIRFTRNQLVFERTKTSY